jgi:hypothetical protein
MLLDCNDGAALGVAPVKGPDPKLRNEFRPQVSPSQVRDACGPHLRYHHTWRTTASDGVQLLGNPTTRRMPRDINVQDAPPIMTDDEEAVKHAERNRWHCEEIHRGNRFPMDEGSAYVKSESSYRLIQSNNRVTIEEGFSFGQDRSFGDECARARSQLRVWT